MAFYVCRDPTVWFLSCLDILHAFIASIDPSLTRAGYVERLTCEQRMSELDSVAEDFLAAPLARVRTSPDGKLVFGGHGDDATLLDVVSHGFFHRLAARTMNGGVKVGSVGSDPGKFHVKRREHPTPLTNAQKEHQEQVVASSPPVRDAGFASAFQRPPLGKNKHVRFKDAEDGGSVEGASPSTPTPFTHALGVCHRLAVFDVDRDKTELTVTAVMSQLDVVRFFHRHTEALNHLRDMTLSELGLLTSPRGVVTAPWDSTALECFKLMSERKVSAVGVVDRDGELVANLSASDLRMLDERSFRLLALPVAEFISRRKGDAIGRRGTPFAEAREMEAGERLRECDVDTFRDDSDGSDGSDPSTRLSASRTFVELIFARAETTLGRLVSLMATHSIHHVYVIDENDAPIAVITPTDVLRLFVVDDEDCLWNVVWAPGQGVEEAMDAHD